MTYVLNLQKNFVCSTAKQNKAQQTQNQHVSSIFQNKSKKELLFIIPTAIALILIILGMYDKVTTSSKNAKDAMFGIISSIMIWSLFLIAPVDFFGVSIHQNRIIHLLILFVLGAGIGAGLMFLEKSKFGTFGNKDLTNNKIIIAVFNIAIFIINFTNSKVKTIFISLFILGIITNYVYEVFFKMKKQATNTP